MPLGTIIAGLAAAGVTALGAGTQKRAKKTNEQAQQLAKEAQQLYDSAKESLEIAQSQTENALMTLGTLKKEILETSIKQFLAAYERIKNIELSQSVGLNELQSFSLEKQDAIQLRKMSNIYQSAFSSSVAGVATGTVIALAASGSLPVVTGVLSTAGTALMAGEVGLATGLASSALSFASAVTPLAAIAAPVILFTGISANIKAEENLEKAQAMYAEAEDASEKMENARILCCAIVDRAHMFEKLLSELNAMFSQCAALLDGVTKMKRGLFRHKLVNAGSFTEDELKLVAVTRALAGAVKAVIDTPILTTNGAVSSESEHIYAETSPKIPAFIEATDAVKRVDYHTKVKVATVKRPMRGRTAPTIVRNVFALLLGVLIAWLTQITFGTSLWFGAFGFSTTALLVMEAEPIIDFFFWVRKACCTILVGAFIVLFFTTCKEIVNMKHYVIVSIGVGFTSYLILDKCIDRKSITNSLMIILEMLLRCIACFAIAIIAYAFLRKTVGFSHTVSVVITVVLWTGYALNTVFNDG